MIVLQITSDYPPNPLWGMGQHVQTLSTALKENGLSVYIATANKSAGYENNIITTSQKQDKLLLSSGKYEIFNNFHNFIKWQEALAEEIIKSGIIPDIIHCHNWMSWITARKIKEVHKNAKVVTTFHLLQKQYELMIENPIPTFHKDIIRIENEAAMYSDKIITLSKSQKKLLIYKYSEKIRKDKINLIPNGVRFKSVGYSEIKSIRSESNIFEIVFIGRIEEDKGIRFLIDGFIKLKKYHNNVKLNVVGKGPLLDELSKKYGAKSIIFHGFISRKKIQDILIRSSIFCMPSTSEALPTTVMEAMLFGTVPIFSKGVTVPTLFKDNIHGLKVPLRFKNGKYLPNSDDVYQKLELLVTDKKMYNKLSYNCYKYANTNFTAGKMVEKIMLLYNSLI